MKSPFLTPAVRCLSAMIGFIYFQNSTTYSVLSAAYALDDDAEVLSQILRGIRPASHPAMSLIPLGDPTFPSIALSVIDAVEWASFAPAYLPATSPPALVTFLGVLSQSKVTWGAGNTGGAAIPLTVNGTVILIHAQLLSSYTAVCCFNVACVIGRTLTFPLCLPSPLLHYCRL